MKKKIIIILGFIIIFLDQIIRYLVEINKTAIDLKLFNITYIQNIGGAYGFLSNDFLLIILIDLIVITSIITYLLIKKNINPIAYKGLTLILAGGTSNLLDRIVHGYVIDYIDINKWFPFAIFNIADICIVIGGILLIIAIIKEY